MIAGARRYDKVPPYVFYGPETLINELSNGRPAGVLLNLGGLEMAPRWHYAVVTGGVDFENSRIILHSGTNKNERMKLATFDHTWRRGSYWGGLYVLNPDDIPESADPIKYIQSVSAFENMGRHDIAERAYLTAYKRWNDNLYVLLGIANISYRKNDLNKAEEYLSKAVELHPNNGEALNNYAYVLFELVDMTKL